jgi:hypothetical protein
LGSSRWVHAAIVGFLLSGLGCSTPYIHPLNAHFDNSFRDFYPAERDKVKESLQKREYPCPYDQLFDNTLQILQQYAVIAKASRDSGFITFVDVDAVLLDDKFPCHEFTFTLLLEKTGGSTTVYVHPMTSLFETKDLENMPLWKKNWSTINAAYVQKGNEFLEKLSVQLTASKRWPWLSR